MSELTTKPNTSLRWIRILSVAIPLVVAILLALPYKLSLGDWVYNLPHAIGILNSLTALCLIIALAAIKKKNVSLHKTMNTAALVLGAVFLVCYVLYHASANHTPYGGDGALMYVYYTLLISHIVLSISVVPLVLLAFYHAWNKDFEKHKKLVKYTFPIWLYVSVSGVAVYLLISPYYQF
jgi:putative membrane protein